MPHLHTFSVTTGDPKEWAAVNSELVKMMAIIGRHFPTATISSTDMDVEYTEGIRFDEDTMFKVYDALLGTGWLEPDQCRQAITAMQNAGILFREHS